MNSQRKYFFLILVGCLLILAAYSNTFFSPPVLDDFHTFVRNPLVHVEKIDKATIERLTTSQFGVWRFLPMVSFAFDYEWGDGAIWAFHLTNLLIHFLNFFAVFFFCWSLRKTPLASLPSFQGRFLFSAAVASLWALHPVQTAAVIYLVQRMASMQSLFYVSSAASYLNARIAAHREKKRLSLFWALLCGLFLLGAAFSKENSATLPVLFLFMEVWFFQPELPKRIEDRVRRVLRSGYRGVIPILFLVGVLAWSCVTAYEMFSGGFRARHFTLEERLLTEARVVIQYLYTILLPNPNRLSIEHDVPLSTALWAPPTTLLSILCIAFLVFVSWKARLRFSVVSFGILWFFLNLVIESTIVPLELKFDHRMYLPSVGIILGIVEGVRIGGGRFLNRFRESEVKKIAWSTLAIVCSVLSLQTYSRNHDWRNIVSINHDAVVKAPQNPRAHVNYAVALLRVGRHEEAMAEARKAIELGRPGLEEHFVAATTIVTAYMKQEKWRDAVEEGRRLLQDAPKTVDVGSLPMLHLKLAWCHFKLGEYREAYSQLADAKKIIDIKPRLEKYRPWVYASLRGMLKRLSTEGNADWDGDGKSDPGELEVEEWMAKKLYEWGDFKTAERFARKMPDSPVARDLLERMALYRERTTTQAENWNLARKYLRKPSGLSDVSLGLAYVLLKHADFKPMRSLALRLLRFSERQDPMNPDVHLLLGWQAFKQDQFLVALNRAHRAIELKPRYAKAWIALGFFAQKSGFLEESLVGFQQTLELYPGHPQKHAIQNLIAELRHSLLARHESSGLDLSSDLGARRWN